MKMVKVLAERIRRKTPPVFAIQYNLTIKEAATLFNKTSIGAALVEKEIPEPGVYAGIISEKDIMRCCAEYDDLSKVQVADVMRREMITANVNDEVTDIVRRMRDYHIRHIPLIEDGKIIALISIRDIMNCIDLAQEIAMSHLNDLFGSTRHSTSY
jgi:predicted transcriptional regulator